MIPFGTILLNLLYVGPQTSDLQYMKMHFYFIFKFFKFLFTIYYLGMITFP